MPKTPPRPCRRQGCGKLVDDGSGYCAAHQADRNIGKFADKFRGSRHQRGYGTDWDKRRKLVLVRDNGLCRPCLKEGRVTPATQVDHIVCKAEGGGDDEENLQAICKDCHELKTIAEALRARAG